MKKGSTRFSVNIEGAGGEEELYFSAEVPQLIAVQIPEMVPAQFQAYIEFTAQNGYPRGQKLRVPVERVVWISEEGIS